MCGPAWLTDAMRLVAGAQVEYIMGVLLAQRGKSGHLQPGQGARPAHVGTGGLPIWLAPWDFGNGRLEQAGSVGKQGMAQECGEAFARDDALADARVIVGMAAQRLRCVADVPRGHAVEADGAVRLG